MGELTLIDVPPAPKGQPRIKVVFDVDADGILAVSAEDEGALCRRQSFNPCCLPPGAVPHLKP